MAYVNSSNTIHMCDLFFDLPESCNSYPKKKQGRQHHDNLAGVLLHEISHRCETSDDFYFERVNSEASLECKDYFSNLLFGKSSQEITQDEKDESKIKNPNSISHFPNAITFISPSSKKVTSIEELKKVPNSSFTWGHLADSYYFWSIYGFCIPDLNECPEYN
jgi:hypothetical protein